MRSNSTGWTIFTIIMVVAVSIIMIIDMQKADEMIKKCDYERSLVSVDTLCDYIKTNPSVCDGIKD